MLLFLRLIIYLLIPRIYVVYVSIRYFWLPGRLRQCSLKVRPTYGQACAVSAPLDANANLAQSNVCRIGNMLLKSNMCMLPFGNMGMLPNGNIGLVGMVCAPRKLREQFSTA